MTIFDLPGLDPDEAFTLALATLERCPMLKALFDEAFLQDLVRRRGAHDNFLLLLFVQPEDELALERWTGIADNLALLEPEGALAIFGQKFRRHSRQEFEQAQTELEIAAWLKRKGFSVALEVPVGNGNCDILAGTTPETMWEIKSIADLDTVQRDDLIAEDVQRRLRCAQQPYILSVSRLPATLADAPRAVKGVVAALRAHADIDGALPFEVQSRGLQVVASARPGEGRRGFLGTILGNQYVFETEHSERVRKRVKAAAGQLPESGAGIALIDCSGATWLDDDDVVDACFGDIGYTLIRGEVTGVLKDGLFAPGKYTRVSAVTAYERRRYSSRPGPYSFLVVHNPYAKVALPKGWLRAEHLKHVRLVDLDGGRRKFNYADE